MPGLVVRIQNILFSGADHLTNDPHRQFQGDPMDDSWRQFAAGGLGASEYARHLRATLGWPGGDDELVEMSGRTWGAVDLDVVDVLATLRAADWHLIAVENLTPWDEDGFTEIHTVALELFHRRVTSLDAGACLPDPRFFAAVRRVLRGASGPYLFVDTQAEPVAGARSSGLDAAVVRDAHSLMHLCATVRDEGVSA